MLVLMTVRGSFCTCLVLGVSRGFTRRRQPLEVLERQ